MSASMRGEAYTLEAGGVHLLPILHGELEFAQLVVEAFRRLRPAALAVELPRSIGAPFRAAVRRLPQVSGLRYRTALGAQLYFLVEPADPLVEAVRLGLQSEVPVHFVDLDLESYPEYAEALPDSYAVTRIGHRAYVEACLASPVGERRGPEDLRREAAMAARLTALARGGGPVLFVGGLAHVRRIAAQIGASDAEPLDRHAREVTLFNLHPASCGEVLATWCYLGAAYERARAQTLGTSVPREARESASPRVINLFERMPQRAAEPSRGDAPPPAPESLPPRAASLPVDRQRVLLQLYDDAGRRYEATTGEQLKPYHRRVYLKFLRNWALSHARLQPSLYQIVVGARAAVDDNFAYELFQLASSWPWQREQAEIPTEPVSLEDLGRRAERVRFRPRQVTRRLRAMAGRRKLGGSDDWIQGFDDPFGHCSYPPEDLALESFSTYVQKKARGVLSEENKRVEPFSTSLLDGIDMRETIRNWHEGKLYVAELRKGLGGVGSVIIVFDEDRERYPWEMTWLGEMAQEGDMALFSTHPLQQIVGPGICRAEYGGFLLSYPPGRMSDVWGDEAFDAARTRAERLLMAGVDYCEHKLVAYVARKPPRPEMKAWAARFGKKIVYLPIGQFSPDTLKKLRVFHVLYGKDKREFAKDYVW